MDASIIKSIFNRCGQAGIYTKPFADFSEQERTEVLSSVILLSMEEPVVAYINDNWLLVTNLRIIFSFDESIGSFFHNEILDATFDKFQALRKGVRNAAGLEDIVINLSGGIRYSFQIEGGPPFSALWNIFKSIAASNVKIRNE